MLLRLHNTLFMDSSLDINMFLETLAYHLFNANSNNEIENQMSDKKPLL